MTPEETQRSLELSWEEIEKLHTKLKWLLSLQASGADQRADLALRVERNTLSLDKLTEQFLLLRQQRDEVNAATDERERLWVHEHRVAVEGFTRALIDLREKIAADEAADDVAGKAAEKVAEKTAEAAAATVEVARATESAARELREATASHRVHKVEDDDEESRHAGIWGVIPRIVIIILKAPSRVKVLVVALLLLAFGGLGAWVGYSVYDRINKRYEQERDEGRARWERRPRVEPESAPSSAPAPR